MGDEPLDINAGNDESGSWIDITESLALAAKELELGEMMRASNFNLSDAMCALELMDPRMDESMQKPVETLPSRLERGVLKVEVSIEEAVAIVEGLLPYEVGWIRGGQMLDTIFVCLYPHSQALHHLSTLCNVQRDHGILNRESKCAPSLAPSFALLTIVLATLKTVYSIRKLVLTADIYEEEDLVPNTHSLYMGTTHSEDDMIYLLNEADKLLGSFPGGSSAGLVEVLRTHIRLRLELFCLVTQLNDFSPTRFDTEWLRCKETVSRCEALLAELAGLVKKRPPNSLPDVGFAFDAGVARCLKGNTPRRVTKIETPLEALDSWSRLVGELDEALNMFTYERFHEVRSAMEQLSQQSPNIFTCSFLQVHFYQDDCTLGRHLGAMLLSEHLMSAYHVPTAVVTSEACQNFLVWVSKPIHDGLRIFLSNRSRQRARLETYFQDLSVMQTEAMISDTRCQQEMELPEQAIQYLLMWILDETARMMQHYLVLGLELNLYAVPEELEAVFWYLDYLACSRLHQMKLLREHKMKMNAIKHMLEEEERNKKEVASSGGGGGGKKKRKKSKGGGKKKSGGGSASDCREEEEDVEEELRAVRDNVELNIDRALAKGLHYFLAGLRRAALDPNLAPSAAVKKASDRVFVQWADRFYHRFKAFIALQQPPLIQATHYLELTDYSDLAVDFLLHRANEFFKLAKTYVDQAMHLYEHELSRQALRDLAKVSVANSVSIAQVVRKLADGGTLANRITPSYKIHSYFPLLQIE